MVAGMINLDFADVKTIMAGMGFAMMGTGVAEGQDRAVEAARRAISSPLLEGASVTGARGVIINVTGGPDLSLVEVSEASSIVQEAADEDANIIFGAVVDPMLKGKVKITVIATGFGPPTSIRPSAAAQTPIDMSQYTDYSRTRVDNGGGGAGAGDIRAGRQRPADYRSTAVARSAGCGRSIGAVGARHFGRSGVPDGRVGLEPIPQAASPPKI